MRETKGLFVLGQHWPNGNEILRSHLRMTDLYERQKLTADCCWLTALKPVLGLVGRDIVLQA